MIRCRHRWMPSVPGSLMRELPNCLPRSANCGETGHSPMIQTLFGSVEQEPSLLERLKSGVQKTRAGLVTRLEDMLQGAKQIDAALLDELEFTLISSDIGVRTTEEILDRIRERVDRRLVGDAAELEGLIREHLLEINRRSG